MGSQMTFQALRVIDEGTIDLEFAADDGQTIVHRFTARMVPVDGMRGGVLTYQGDSFWESSYRSIPGLAIERWPVELIRNAYLGHRDPLPIGERLASRTAEVLARNAEDFERLRRKREQGPTD
jgi:hypothetical protein